MIPPPSPDFFSNGEELKYQTVRERAEKGGPSMPFEVLNFSFVLLGGFPRLERAQVPSFPRLGILF